MGIPTYTAGASDVPFVRRDFAAEELRELAMVCTDGAWQKSCKFARFERRPISRPRPKLNAALTVAAVMDSAGVIFICVEASDKTIGMDAVGRAIRD